jgi:hypothetical protein
MTASQSSQGHFLYLLGLVVIATHPGRLWLGIGLAGALLMIEPLATAVAGGRWRGGHLP